MTKGSHKSFRWGLGLTVAVMILALLLVASAALLAIGWLVFHTWIWNLSPPQEVSVVDVLTPALTIAAGIGATVALVVAFRKQRLAEAKQAIELEVERRAIESHFGDRFQRAAEQLGHESAETRLAGVYAMERLANDWEDQRQVCIDVLCGYLRQSRLSADSAGETVHRAILEVIRQHLLPSTHPERRNTSWQSYIFNIVGMKTADVSLSEIVIEPGTHIDLSGSVLNNNGMFFLARIVMLGGSLWMRDVSAGSSGVSLVGAVLQNGTLNLCGANIPGGLGLHGARFTGGSLLLHGAKIDSDIDFDHAALISGMIDFTSLTLCPNARLLLAEAYVSNTDLKLDDMHYRPGQVEWGSVRPVVPEPRNLRLRLVRAAHDIPMPAPLFRRTAKSLTRRLRDEHRKEHLQNHTPEDDVSPWLPSIEGIK